MEELFHQIIVETPFVATVLHVKPLTTIKTEDGRDVALLRLYAEDKKGKRCELRFFHEYAQKLSDDEVFHEGQELYIQWWRMGAKGQNFPIVNVQRFEIDND